MAIHEAFAEIFTNIFATKIQVPMYCNIRSFHKLNICTSHTKQFTVIHKYVLNNQYFVCLALISVSV